MLARVFLLPKMVKWECSFHQMGAVTFFPVVLLSTMPFLKVLVLLFGISFKQTMTLEIFQWMILFFSLRKEKKRKEKKRKEKKRKEKKRKEKKRKEKKRKEKKRKEKKKKRKKFSSSLGSCGENLKVCLSSPFLCLWQAVSKPCGYNQERTETGRAGGMQPEH